MIGLLALAAASVANPSLEGAQRAYNVCARRMAVRLERSGDSPEDIARASQTLCSKERFAAINAALAAGGSAVEDTERAAKFYAAAEVTIARLCRKTQDCIDSGLR